MNRKIILIFFIAVITSSCRVFNPSQMLRGNRHFKYSIPSSAPVYDEYRIAPYDLLNFSISPNNGEKLISDAQGLQQQNLLTQGLGYTYNVESDGKVKFPIFGRIQIANLTLKEAEKLLEDKFSVYIKDPYVQLKVENKRIIVIYSFGTVSKVVTLEHDNTTIFEMLAQSGGISGGKAYKIKLIRGSLKNPQIFILDLSTIKGVINSDLVLQANDIIYIETPLRLESRIVSELTPYFTLLTTLTLVYSIFKK